MRRLPAFSLALVSLLCFGLKSPAGMRSLAGSDAPPARNPGASRLQAPGNGEALDINTAEERELRALPGMGVVYARRIIENRPYMSKNQLLTKGILPQTAYEAIRDRIVAHRPSLTR